MNHSDGILDGGTFQDPRSSAQLGGTRGEGVASLRSIRSQQRAGRFRANQHSQRLHNLHKSTRKFLHKNKPTFQQLLSAVKKEQTTPKQRTTDQLKATAQELLQTRKAEELKVKAQLQELAKDALGWVPPQKPDDVIRILFENRNSLGIFNSMWKVKKINDLISQFQADGVFSNEDQINWTMVDHDMRPQELFQPGKQKRCIEAHNIHESFERSQPGGTSAMVFNRLTSFVSEMGVDPTGLGRWSWVKVGFGGYNTVLVTAYQPVRPATASRCSKKRKRRLKCSTVWHQHRRYFLKKGEFRCPRTLWFLDLVQQLVEWRSSDFNVLLMTDANEDIYTGRLAKRLQEDDLLMTELCMSFHGVPAPASHIRGKRAIKGVFKSPGLVCMNYMICQHGRGVGDHRLHVVDLCAFSTLGTPYPTLGAVESRKLTCKCPRVVVKYNRVLKQLALRHRLFDKTVHLDAEADRLEAGQITEAEFQLSMSKWDNQLKDFMLCAEDKSNKFFDCKLDYSPEIGIWLQRRRLYTLMETYHDGKMRDSRNFRRACRKALIDPPNLITPQQRVTLLASVNAKIESLRKEAPRLRRAHLHDRLKDARERSDQKAVNAIVSILKSESTKKTFRNIKCTTNPRTSGAMGALQVMEEGMEHSTMFHDKQNLCRHASSELDERFRLAYSAPIFQEAIFDDVGYCGNTDATIAILRGEYTFPPDTDIYTRTLCERAAAKYATMSAHETSIFVTTDDFIFYWKTQDERVKSSPSRLHMSHYRAASSDRHNASLHAWKLSICARTGVPLERWGFGITVLLEKIFGAVLMEDMRAICLFEADANWWTKLVFARRMMDAAVSQGAIPEEQFARKGRRTEDGSICTILFSDIVRTQHHPASISKCDLGQAYDRVAHPIQSIACQAFGVPAKAVAMWLLIMQSMAFYISTAYGLSDEPYGGTASNPTMGDGQGSGFAPPAFNCLSALMIEAYKVLGHGARLASAWSGVLLWMAAVIFVDDTDLLHWAPTYDTPKEAFLRRIQTAINDWGRLVQATGGILKKKKCNAYLMLWKFRRGIAKLQTPKEMGDPQLTIPQPDGSEVEIPLLPCTQATKGLGIFSSPDGDFTTHVEERIVKNGLGWADKLALRPLPRMHAWISLKSQLTPSMCYGIGVISHPMEKMEKAYGRVYFKLLPFLGMNRNIRKEFRTLPKKFHGVGLPNLNIECVCAKLDLLLRHWSMPDAVGSFLQHAFEVLQLETGLSGNLLSMPFSKYGFLATQTWFQHLWSLLSSFELTIEMESSASLPLCREHDKSIMQLLVDSGNFSEKSLLAINRVRKFKHLSSLSDLVLMDGKTCDERVFTRHQFDSSWNFSYEKPTANDFKQWNGAVRTLFQSTLTLPHPLGAYTTLPHLSADWKYSPILDELYYCISASTVVVYSRQKSHYNLRHHETYHLSHQDVLVATDCVFASTTMIDAQTVMLHSTAKIPMAIKSDFSFWAMIQSFSNQSLFREFHCDGDGSWILNSIRKGSLLICSDGSFMPMVDKLVCSGAFIIQCSESGLLAKGVVVEKSDSAGNYRGEILGSYMAALTIYAATIGTPMADKPLIQFGCDNEGVNSHGNHLQRSLPAKQSQADLLRAYKNVRLQTSLRSSNVYVASHQDDVVPWCHLSPLEKLNCLCDAMAKDAIVESIFTNNFITSSFPFERLRVHCQGRKCFSKTKDKVYDVWGAKVARKVLHDKKILDRKLFDIVDWEALGSVTHSHGPAFSAWITKHITHCCGTNRHLSKFDKSVKNVCPSCGRIDESTAHILRCRDEMRTKMFHLSVDELDHWLGSTRTSSALRTTIIRFLRARGTKSMLSCVPPFSDVSAVARSQDKLGWDALLEGRVSRLFYQSRLLDVEARQLKGSARKWSNQLVARLLKITHAQWCFRNQLVHHQVSGQKNVKQLQELIARTKELAMTDPMDLLEDHRDLLDVDFDSLMDGNASDLDFWVAEMESAKEAAIHARRLLLADRRRLTRSEVRRLRGDLTSFVPQQGEIRRRTSPRLNPYQRVTKPSSSNPDTPSEPELRYKRKVKYK